MAAVLQWNFLHQTITSRTRVEQLTVDVDHLRRLNDAHCARCSAGRPVEGESAQRDEEYYNPGIFWWAFNPHRPAGAGCRPRRKPRAAARLDGVGRDRPQANGNTPFC
jgi:hypothetical protein